MKKEKRKLYFEAFLQIGLMIGMTFAFSYILHEADSSNSVIVENNTNVLLNLLNIFNKIVFSNNIVSALTSEDLQNGVYTCPRNNNGSLCQEYSASQCAANCAVSCLPTRADETSACKPGTCYDSFEGTCQTGATQGKCQENGGQWFDERYGNIAECKPGCCILGDNAYLGTKQQCTRSSFSLGVKKDFRPEINTELACIALSKTQESGACVFEQESSNTCKYTTKTTCVQSLGGKFYSGVLCSNSDLKTNCIKQQKVQCTQGKDEIYWYDSCGNQENIYEGSSQVQKEHSFNSGKILAKNDSCSLADGNNLLANQATCGNCNYLLGSICGKSAGREKLSGINSDFVCKDLSCKDENGNKRASGESWCAYQGSVGNDKGAGGYLRSTDTTGSRDFRKVCIDGNVRTEPCADYRNEICVESQTNIPNGKFSSAACRINRAYTCYDYNKEGKKDQCAKNPDCFVKHVEVSSGFKFDICAPKYVPGFDLEQRGEGSSAICALASQKCTVVYVKGITGWSCKANCDCEKPKFAEQMNDLCISLGDCGSKANYQGDFVKNHAIFKSGKKDSLGKEIGGPAGKLSAGYINGLVKYADEKLFKGKYAEAGDLAEFYGELGVPGWLGSAANPEDPTAGIRGIASQISGMSGIALMAAAHFDIAIPGLVSPGLAGTETAAIPGLTAAGSVLVGAGIGLSVVSFLLDFTGVGAGLPPALTYSLMAVGTAAGAVIGAAALAPTSGALANFALPLLTAAWIAIVVVVVVIIVFSLIGVGKVKKVYYSFQCNPWEAATGGDKCGQCGKDGFPCSKYSCQSLGQTCQLINEDSKNSACVSIGQDDAAPPLITPETSVLPEGYNAEIFEKGVKIKSSSDDGCINNVYGAIPFGISLNEYGQCKISTEHTDSFDNMEESISSGLFLTNHSVPIIIPSLDALGIESFNPNKKADFNIYVRCQDKNGNKNVNEFAINICVKPGNDTTPAIVTGREPTIETVGFETTAINTSIFTNEPADCKWSEQDKSYELMNNNFTCLNDFEQRELLHGWRCLSEFSMPIAKKESTFFVRCLDQPWLVEENATKRNANTQSYELKFKRSANALKIDSINIDNRTLNFAVEPASVEVIVKTSGGLDGTAKCSYKWGNSTIEFFDTWRREHKQTFQTLFPGNIELPIICEDLAGNIAEKTARFKIKLDTEAPKVSRVYAQDGTLNIVTNEESTCYYGFDIKEQCLFDIENASVMNGDSFVHEIGFDAHKGYYIKCKDKLGHYPGSCSIVVREGNYETQQL